MALAQPGINLLVWTIFFSVLDTIFVLLRFLAAYLIRRKIYADDYFIVLSFINALTLGGVFIWVIVNGMGMPAADMTPEQIAIAFKAIPATYVTWTIGTTSFKLSVLSLYVRIFSVRIFKRLSYGLMALTVGYCVAFLAVFLSSCSPNISQLWNPRPDGYCRDINIGQLGSVSINLAIDVFIIVLPMPFLWRLKMRLRNKIVVSISFSLGFITIGIMIWRIHDLVASRDDPIGDFIAEMPTLALSTMLELWICIIIACIPTLAPILKTYITPQVTKIFPSRSSSGGRSNLRSIITFGRLGGRPRNIYTTVTGGKQTVDSDVESMIRTGNTHGLRLREDATNTTNVTAVPSGDLELNVLTAPPQAIHVQHDVSTWNSVRK